MTSMAVFRLVFFAGYWYPGGADCIAFENNPEQMLETTGKEIVLRHERLGSFNVDISQSSVSGLSAGAYMAGQFFVAFSDDVIGAGIFAGGPYGCAEGKLKNAVYKCMQYSPPINQSDIDRFYETAKEYADDQKIDPLENLRNRKLYVFSGTKDDVVKQEVADWVDNWFERAGMFSSNIVYKDDLVTWHTLPTTNHGDECDYDGKIRSGSPWMSDCDYDGAGEALKHIYGDLNAKSPVTESSGIFIEFPQKDFFKPNNLPKLELQKRYSMNEFGYAYVPAPCMAGELCRIHVVFHGCRQNYDRNPDSSAYNPDDDNSPFGLQVVKYAGYNEWANSNNLIILYPQAQKTARTSYIGEYGNPRGCYDWWGYIDGTDDTYATKEAPQMAAVYAMMRRIAGVPVAAIAKAEQEGTNLVIEGTVTDSNDNIENLKVVFLYDTDKATGKKNVSEFNSGSGKFKHSEPWPQDNIVYRTRFFTEYAEKQPYEIAGPEIKAGQKCKEWNVANSIHRSKGRTTSCWFWLNCAVGSYDYLGLDSTTTTVRREDPEKEYYKRGACTQ